MPTPDSGGLDLGDVPSWLALIFSLVSLGWQGVTEYRSSRKEKASIQLSRIEAFERYLEDVRAASAVYWMSPEAESAKEGLVLLHLFRSMARDAKRYKPIFWDAIERDTLELKIQITGGSFQQADRPVYPANDPFIKRMSVTIAGMSSKLKDARDKISGC